MNALVKAYNKAWTQASFAAHRAAYLLARAAAQPHFLPGQHAAAALLRSSGRAIIPADTVRCRFVEEHYANGMRVAWDNEEGVWRDPPNGGTHKLFLANVCERWPAVLDLLDGEIGAMLESYFGTHYQVSYVEAYRTFPADGPLPKSWFWHNDAVAPHMLKVMVYLNGAGEDTGALRVLNRRKTSEIRALGFRSRADSTRYQSTFDRLQEIAAGKPGDSVTIDNVVLHKASAPLHRFRDVVCYQVMPSRRPERIARNLTKRSRSYTASTPQFPFIPPIV